MTRFAISKPRSISIRTSPPPMALSAERWSSMAGLRKPYAVSSGP
jgi:hypothetical protein